MALATAFALPPGATAHPLGNTSVTHFDVIYVLRDRLELDLMLDIAETPSMLLQREKIDTDGDGADTTAEQRAWLDETAAAVAPMLRAVVNGRPLSLQPVDNARDPQTGKPSQNRLILKMAGVAGMPTYRLLIRYAAPYPEPLNAGTHTLVFEDAIWPEHQGLRRILLERTTDAEFIPPRPKFWDEGEDPFVYEQYDPGQLPQEKTATIKFRLTAPGAQTQPTAPASQPGGSGSSDPQPPPYFDSLTRNDPARSAESFRQADRLVAMLQGRWGLAMLLGVTALSFFYGAAHALMPGHAKTVVAAYLISQHGTYWQAVALAAIVTVTHTALVVAMGLIIWATHPAMGAQLQSWLGVIAGAIVAIMGVGLAWRAVTGRLGHHHHEHPHDHEHRSWWRKLFTHTHPHLPHEHPHQVHADYTPGHGQARHHVHPHLHDHGHSHAHDHGHSNHGHGHAHPHRDAQSLTFRTLLLLGITGGLVPCPTATIIMLLGIGANVVAGALYAVGVFSLGLALTLMGVGFLALSSRRFAARLLRDAQHEGEISSSGQRLLLQVIPAASGVVVAVLGGLISAHYLHLLRTGRGLVDWIG